MKIENLLLIKLHVQNAKVEPIVQKQVEECIGSCDSSIGVLAQKLKKFSHAESGTSPVVKGRIKRKLEKVVYPFRESTLAKIRENVAGAQANVDTALEILQMFVASLFKSPISYRAVYFLYALYSDICLNILIRGSR